MYFNAHVCLAAYMNILSSLNATCITIVKPDVVQFGRENYPVLGS